MECVAAVLTRDSTNNDRVPIGLGRQWLEATRTVARVPQPISAAITTVAAAASATAVVSSIGTGLKASGRCSTPPCLQLSNCRQPCSLCSLCCLRRRRRGRDSEIRCRTRGCCILGSTLCFALSCKLSLGSR